MIKVTPKSYPALCAAFQLIEGRGNIAEFDVPYGFISTVGPAEAALKQLQKDYPADFDKFISAWSSGARTNIEEKRDVRYARELLIAFAGGWEPDYTY